ncbi:MAG: hypothetical protein SFV23_09320 [Planctomycetaceae bacterium]|nr:hypothetical protein [Planctomycetaceae bacterium]
MSSIFSFTCALIMGGTVGAELPPDPPPQMEALVTAGQVTIEYVSDPEFVELDRGNCEFQLEFARTFQYRFQTIRRSRKPLVRITMTSIDPTVTVSHAIRMPAPYARPKPWESRLLRHEFDHVAVGCDPRAKLLLKYLVRQLPPIEHPLQVGETADAVLCEKLINLELDRREDAVTEVIRRSNQLLDALSRHGEINIPERAQFFAKLYTKEHLASLDFPFVAEALKVFETEAYIAAERFHLEQDPTIK